MIVAIQEFLSNRGYKAQVQEIEQAFLGKRSVKPLNMDYLDEKQRQTALILMQHRNMPEESAVKWVIEHKDQVGLIWR